METKFYDERLGIDGTIDQLIDWAYRYDEDYSNEALEMIASLAASYGADSQKARIPLLVLRDRERQKRNDGTLPYENMIIDHILNGSISFSETKDYGEVEIFEDRGKVLLSITGTDARGTFSAAATVPVEEFVSETNESGWLESMIGITMFYNNQYCEN